MVAAGLVRREPAARENVDREPDDDGSWLIRRGEHEEAAQVVARCSIRLAAGAHVDEVGIVALELLRVANHDPATLEHALVVCRSLARDDPTNERVKHAIRLLRRVTTFLGVPRRLGDVSVRGRAVPSAPVTNPTPERADATEAASRA